MKKLLLLVLTLSIVLASVAPAMAASSSAVTFPLGASNRTIVLNGTEYLINDTYTTNGWNGSNNIRGTIPGYAWDASFETYTFNPDAIDGVTLDSKYGFPLRASYRTPTDYFGEMNYLAQTYPNLVKLQKIGNTVGISRAITGGANPGADPAYSAPLYAMEICNAPGTDDGRPAALHMGGNHGGELPSNELAMNLAWYLTTNYGKPGYEDVTELLDTTKVFILPMTNEDGTIASMRATGGRRQNANGVDPNRNWPYGWGSNNGSADSSRGTAPCSEPEIKAVTGLYESNQIVASLSGHTSGQIVIYAWGHQTSNYISGSTVEGTVGIPLLNKLAGEMTALNMHHEQPSEGLYPASGDLCDYTWGLARALHFTVEYGTVQAPAYMGQNRYMAYTNYNDANGNTRKIPLTYSSNANSRQPAADLTAPVAFVDNPKYYISGYGSAEKQATLTEVQALGDITGKILITPQGISTTETANIIAAAQAQGAVGVLISTAGSAAHANNSTGATFYSPGNVAAAITIPVAGTSKPYTGEIYNKAKAGENVTVTFKSTQDINVESLYWQWERHIAGYMKNMSFATEYASHIKGEITDGNGQPLDNATLNLSMMADGLVKHPGTYSGSGDNLNGYGDNPMPYGTYEVEHTSVYNVNGGTFDWSVVPSQQPDPQLPSALDPTTQEQNHVGKPDYAEKNKIKDKDGNLTGDKYLQLPDRGYDITASANGRYSDTKNVKVGDYQVTVDGINFDLPKAVTSTFDFNSITDVTQDVSFTFNAFNKDGSAYTGKVSALLNGYNVSVTGNNTSAASAGSFMTLASSSVAGEYTITFNLEKMGIGSADKAVLIISLDNGEDMTPLVFGDVNSLNTDDNLILASDKGSVVSGEGFNLTAAFASEEDSNAAVLLFNFDPDVFEVPDSDDCFTPAAGVSLLDTVVTNGQVKVVVGVTTGYGITELGSLALQAKAGLDFNGMRKTFAVSAQYVLNTDPKTIANSTAYTNIRTDIEFESGAFTVIDLSNIIDWFNFDSSDPDWFNRYADWDFNNNSKIDIYDICFVAKLVEL